jgi:hypothetical protein
MSLTALSKKQKTILSFSCVALIPLGLLAVNPNNRVVTAGDATSYSATFDSTHPLTRLFLDTYYYWGISTSSGSYISLCDPGLGATISTTSIVVGADKWFNVGFAFSDDIASRGARRIAFIESINVTFTAGSSSLKVDYHECADSQPAATDSSGNQETYALTSGVANSPSSNAITKYYGSGYSTGRNSLYAAIAAGSADSVTVSALTLTYRC